MEYTKIKPFFVIVGIEPYVVLDKVHIHLREWYEGFTGQLVKNQVVFNKYAEELGLEIDNTYLILVYNTDDYDENHGYKWIYEIKHKFTKKQHEAFKKAYYS